MANMFTSKLNDRDFLDAFGINQDDDSINPEEVASGRPVNYNQLIQEEALNQAMPEVNESNYMPSAMEEASNQTRPSSVVPRARKPRASESALEGGDLNFADLTSNFDQQMANLKKKYPQDESTESPPNQTQQTAQETPLSKSEALIAEYKKILESDQEALAEARKSDRMLKVGGALGDTLATYLNAKSQMDVKAPGVQIQQGAGLGKVADMFATSPEIASDITQRREAMMKQYAELAKGERAQARLTSEESRAKDADLRARELAQMQIDGRLKEAGIKASGKGSAGVASVKPTVGEQTIDREFAKDFNEWRTGGKADYEESKKIFDEAIDSLKVDPNAPEKKIISTGFFEGVGAKLPGIRTEAKQLETRVRKSLNSMLRATLGAQFTETEGEKIFQQTFDPHADPIENIKNMQTELSRIEKKAKSIESQGKYFTKQKTLSGYEPEVNEPIVESINNDDESKIELFMKNNPKIKDKNTAIKILRDNRIIK